jgi:endonuclease/exonuclease/phosphatase family metal-dependent hydrolase
MSNLKFGELVDTRVRVVSWNLWGRGGPWEARLAGITATLRALDPDVVTLQEVWEETGGRSQATVLAEALGFHPVFAGRYAIDGVAMGNAVLSRWPVVQCEVWPLPAPPEREELRNVMRADIDGPRGLLRVFTTHLNWKFDQSDVRQDQVRVLAALVADVAGGDVPPVLAGDFNAAPDSDEIRMLTGRTTVPVPGLVFQDAWELAGDGGPGHTWANANPWARADLEPDRRIDYVFAGFPRWGGVGHVVACGLAGGPVDGLYPSDHLAVVADLRY